MQKRKAQKEIKRVNKKKKEIQTQSPNRKEQKNSFYNEAIPKENRREAFS